MKCIKCNNIIPQGRVNLGYKICVNCSTTEQYGCIPITYHKTGNTIQIVSQAMSVAIHKASRRKGYGTCLR